MEYYVWGSAIPNSVADYTCMNCLGDLGDEYLMFNIDMLGYSSEFDGFGTRMQLCQLCYENSPNIWHLEVDDTANDWGFAYYKHEKGWLKYVERMPLAGQELFWNRFGFGVDHCMMQPQDWVDYRLGKLPHSKCQQYGLHSPDEVAAYYSKFPVCQHVFLQQWEDGSCNSKCHLGAYGDKYGECCRLNIYDECYNCTDFEFNPNRDLRVIER